MHPPPPPSQPPSGGSLGPGPHGGEDRIVVLEHGHDDGPACGLPAVMRRVASSRSILASSNPSAPRPARRWAASATASSPLAASPSTRMVSGVGFPATRAGHRGRRDGRRRSARGSGPRSTRPLVYGRRQVRRPVRQRQAQAGRHWGAAARACTRVPLPGNDSTTQRPTQFLSPLAHRDQPDTLRCGRAGVRRPSSAISSSSGRADAPSVNRMVQTRAPAWRTTLVSASCTMR